MRISLFRIAQLMRELRAFRKINRPYLAGTGRHTYTCTVRTSESIVAIGAVLLGAVATLLTTTAPPFAGTTEALLGVEGGTTMLLGAVCSLMLRLPKSLCWLSMELTMFLVMSEFCVLCSRMCEFRLAVFCLSESFSNSESLPQLG